MADRAKASSPRRRPDLPTRRRAVPRVSGAPSLQIDTPSAGTGRRRTRRDGSTFRAARRLAEQRDFTEAGRLQVVVVARHRVAEMRTAPVSEVQRIYQKWFGKNPSRRSSTSSSERVIRCVPRDRRDARGRPQGRRGELRRGWRSTAHLISQLWMTAVTAWARRAGRSSGVARCCSSSVGGAGAPARGRYVQLFRNTRCSCRSTHLFASDDRPPWPAVVCGGLASSSQNAAYISEILRGSVNAIARVQFDAARSIGLAPWSTSPEGRAAAGAGLLDPGSATRRPPAQGHLAFVRDQHHGAHDAAKVVDGANGRGVRGLQSSSPALLLLVSGTRSSSGYPSRRAVAVGRSAGDAAR